jgi:hypothetical protein
MTLKLSGDSPNIESSTLSVNFGDGTAAAPSITFDADVDTGLFRAEADGISITTGGIERMRIDSTGNVSIRTTSGTEPLEVARLTADTWVMPTMPSITTIVTTPGNNSTGSGSAVCIMSGNAAKSSIYFGDSDDADEGIIEYDHAQNDMIFYTNTIDRMRVDSAGRFLVGRSDGNIDGSNFGTRIGGNSDDGRFNTSRNVGSGGSTATIFGTGGECRIRGDGDLENTNNSYGALSDIKFKENIVDANSQWEDIKGLRVRKYNFKEETGWDTHTQIGVVAQELEQVSPGLVSEGVFNEETGETAKAVDYSVLYMKAVKALQEALLRIEDLEQRLNNAGI